MKIDLLKRMRWQRHLLTNPSNFFFMDILNLRSVQLRVLLKDSREIILHTIEQDFEINLAILTMAHVETLLQTI